MFSPALVALLYTPVLLTIFEYCFLPFRIERDPTLYAGLVWSAACVIGYCFIPVAITKYFGGSLSSIGFSRKEFFKHLATYLGLYILMVIPIFIASTMPGFRDTYPFIREVKHDMTKFIIWEVAYVLQFFALESFFRGYLLMTVEKSVGKHLAIAIMIIPYAMIHFHKPMLETFGAIGAGIILGHLALKYRTWMGGAVLHSLVAITMDCISVFR
jgi:uncharacterized protein